MIIFRVDANEYIASGHLMRCMVLALRLRELGEKVLFCMAEEKFANKLEENNLPYRILGTKWNDMHGDLSIMKEIVEQHKPRWVIVDSYQADAEYLETLEQWTKVLYFDDMAKEVYKISAVLHYSDWLDDDSYERKYREIDLNGRKTKVMAGMKFVPLRSEFYKSEEPGLKKNIMITTGGTDAYNVAGNVLREIAAQERLKEYDINVIVGQMNSYKEELIKIAYENKKVHLYYDVNNMGEFMRKSDIAVSAGGTTLFELCACGIPTICFSFAENQEGGTIKFEEERVMYYAGDARYGVENVVDNIILRLSQMVDELEEKADDRNKEKLAEQKNIYNSQESRELNKYSSDFPLNREIKKCNSHIKQNGADKYISIMEMKQRMGELVDGQGALRIAKILLGMEI